MGNPLQDALKSVVPKLGALFLEVVDENKAEIEKRIVAGEVVVIDKVRDAIVAALPSNGILNQALKPEITAAINKLAAQAIAAAGGETAALINLGEMEITQLVQRIVSAP